MTKLKKTKCDKTKKLNMGQNSETQIVAEIHNHFFYLAKSF